MTHHSNGTGDWHKTHRGSSFIIHREKPQQRRMSRGERSGTGLPHPDRHPSENFSHSCRARADGCPQRTSQIKKSRQETRKPKPARGSKGVPQIFSWRLGRWLSMCLIFIIPDAIIKDLEKKRLRAQKGIILAHSSKLQVHHCRKEVKAGTSNSSHMLAQFHLSYTVQDPC